MPKNFIAIALVFLLALPISRVLWNGSDSIVEIEAVFVELQAQTGRYVGW
jgi:hypothetical protein